MPVIKKKHRRLSSRPPVSFSRRTLVVRAKKNQISQKRTTNLDEENQKNQILNELFLSSDR